MARFHFIVILCAYLSVLFKEILADTDNGQNATKDVNLLKDTDQIHVPHVDASVEKNENHPHTITFSIVTVLIGVTAALLVLWAIHRRVHKAKATQKSISNVKEEDGCDVRLYTV